MTVDSVRSSEPNVFDARAMKCQAAVLRGVGKDWEICEVELDPPRRGEVLVRMAVAGICHSDDHIATGDLVPTEDMVEMMRAMGLPATDWFPLLGGHEGAGVVEEVGPNVTSLTPGDRVAMSFIPACGHCRWCVSGQSYICDVGANLFAKEMTTDGTARRHLGDEDLMAMTQLGTFSEYVVASEQSLIKIDDAIPFHAASLVSCGVTTGWGSATVCAGTEAGDTVVVIGTGGVGMNEPSPVSCALPLLEGWARCRSGTTRTPRPGRCGWSASTAMTTTASGRR